MTIFEQGLEKYKAEAYPEALDLLQTFIEKNEDDHRAIYYLALTHFKMGRYDISLQHFNTAIAYDPFNAEYYCDRGVAYFRVKKYKTALTDFDKATEIEPDNSYRYACRAFAKQKLGDHQGAIADYEKALVLDPDDEVSRNNMEMAQEALQYKSKRPKLKSANAFTPEEKEAYKKEYSSKAIERERHQSYWQVFKKIFTSAEHFKDFIRFTLRGMKL